MKIFPVKYCDECGSELGLLRRFKNPLDRENVICGDCLDLISKGLEYYNNCLFNGREDHRNDCYFWNKKEKKCKNEKYFKSFKEFRNSGEVAVQPA